MKNYPWLIVAVIVGVIGFAIGRVLRLSEFSAVAVAVAPAMLVVFPFMKRWAPKATFVQWVFAISVGLLSSWLIYLAISRFAGG